MFGMRWETRVLCPFRGSVLGLIWVSLVPGSGMRVVNLRNLRFQNYGKILKRKPKDRGPMETKSSAVTADAWVGAREAAAHVGVNYYTFTQLAKNGHVPRTKVPGTKKTYRYNLRVLDEWMLGAQEKGLL